MRGWKGQVAAANLSLPEGRMLLNLFLLWGGKITTNLCQRNGWEKSGRKKLQAKVNKMSGLLARLSKADGWYCWLWQLQLKMQETTGEADKYLKITTSCLAQTVSPLLGKQSFVLELPYLFFITGWQRWYLNIIIKIKLLNASNVSSCSKILKPDGLTAPSSQQSQWDIVPSSFIWLCSLLVPPQLPGEVGLAGWLWLPDRLWREREASLYDKQCSFTLRSASCPVLALAAYQVPVLYSGDSVALLHHLCCIFSPTCCLAWQTQPVSGWFSAPCRSGSLPSLLRELGFSEKYSSIPALTRHISVLINLASASGTSPPLGTLYFYSWLEMQV